eukprot:gnl/TRDRNA2_/TRDRNA2_184826_c0_seq1.p1 gnl/TRDRNA2_/TRDRNA2_184826_c0~~gnl/TRDRNA2_/TRDRNA2_184826_c0_seq1.p1  ORF type:complete len:621 (+),score=103.70 gnl/TRDRNA2_/TRDRNA2_184826_c0_seq1:52-1914(+)
MSSREELPKGLRDVFDKLPSAAQKKFLELHNEFVFDEDLMECFLLTKSLASLTADSIQIFEKYVIECAQRTEKKKEASKAVTEVQRVAQAARPLGRDMDQEKVGDNKRKQRSPAPLMGMLGVSDVVKTPNPKRQRDAQSELTGEDGVPSRGTPDPVPMPLHINVKLSVNEHLSKPAGSGLRSPVAVKVLSESAMWTGRKSGAYQWMDEGIEERMASHDARLTELEGQMVAALTARYPDQDLAVGTIGVPVQSEVVLCGRIQCEGVDGKLNERSMLLEGSRASSNGTRIQLDVSDCPRVAAFPGQIVSLLGRSGATGQTFHARDFVAGMPSPPAPRRCQSNLHMIVAAGPFCVRDGLDFAPLVQLLEHAQRERPDVLILMGPFLSSENVMVKEGSTVLPGESEPRSFEDIYAQVIIPRLQKGLAPLRQGATPTDVMIVPSLDEALCFHPMPQPPLNASLPLNTGSFEALNRLGVKMMPNPVHLKVNDVRLTLTSADALSPVVRELTLRPNEKRIEEALRLLLGQRTLFPVLPRNPAEVCDARSSALNFPDGDVPDICIFPSAAGVSTGNFVDDCLFVNPGLLCRATLGTFAEIRTVPPAAGGDAPFRERARVDILKLSSGV